MGDHFLDGGDGNDTFAYNLGYGNDTIFPDHNNFLAGLDDELDLGPGITPDMVSMERPAGTDNLLLSIQGGGSILLTEQFTTIDVIFGDMSFDQIKTIKFADGTIWTPNMEEDRLLTQESSQTSGSVVGFFRDDTIVAGNGNKYLSGGAGNDTYVYTNLGGSDTIDDADIWSDGDTLILQDIQRNDVSFSRPGDGADLDLSIGSTDQTLTIWGQFSGIISSGLESFQFADGSTMSADDVKRLLLAQQTSQGFGNVIGFTSSDVLSAGLGDKYLSGGEGDDTYIYGGLGGNDTINDNTIFSAGDRLILQDFESNDVTFSRPNDGLDLLLSFGSTGKTLLIQNEFWVQSSGLETIQFADGSTITKDEVKQQLLDRATAQSSGTIIGYLYDDTLVAGLGDKYLDGGGGDDTYIYLKADGNDTFADGAQSANDRLILPDIMPGDIAVSPTDPELLTILSTGKTIRLDGEYFNWLVGVDVIQFADGTTWSRNDLNMKVFAAQEAEINGSVYGFSGDDTLTAGPGDKFLDGGDGNDTYLYSVTDGNATVSDITQSNDDVLDFTDLLPSDVTLRASSNGFDLLLSILPSGKSIVIPSEFIGNVIGIDVFSFADGTTWSRSDLGGIIAADADIYPTHHVRSGEAFDPVGETTIVIDPGDDVQIGSSSDQNAYDEKIVWSASSASAVISLRASPAGKPDSVLELPDLLASDVIFSKVGDDLVMVNDRTGKSITFSGQLSSGTGFSGLGSIVFADGTVFDRNQIAAASLPNDNPPAGGSVDNVSDAYINLGPGDGVSINGASQSHGLHLRWSSTSGSASGWWWSFANDANGSDPSVLDLTDLNASDVTLGRIVDNGSDDLVVTNKLTGKTLTLYHQFSGYPYDDIGSIRFADGTTLNHDQITAASPLMLANYSPAPGGSVNNVSDANINLGSGDGVSINGQNQSHGLHLHWSSTSGSASGWWWSFANDANGSDPSVLDLTDLDAADVTLTRISDNGSDDLVVTDKATGKFLTLYHQFSGAPYDDIGSIRFADGTILHHDQIAAASPLVPKQQTNTDTPDFSTIAFGAGDGATLNIYGNWSHGDTATWSSTSGSASAYFYAGYIPQADSVVKLSDLDVADVTLKRSAQNDLLISDNATGKTFTVVQEFRDPQTGIASLQFADGTILDRTALSAAPYRPSANTNIDTASDANIILGAGDGTTLNISGNQSHDDRLTWSSNSGSVLAFLYAGYIPQADSVLSLGNLDASDVTLERQVDTQYGDNLVILNNQSGKSLTLLHMYSGSGTGIANLQFADGTVLDRTALDAAPYRPLPGSNLDTANGSSIVLGAGDGSTLNIYGNWSYGDTASWSSTSGSASAYFYAGYIPQADSIVKLSDLDAADVTLTRTVQNDLLITDNATGKTLTVVQEFRDQQTGIASLQFADGSSLDRNQIAAAAWVRGTSGNDQETNLGASGTTFDLGGGDDSYFDRSVNGNTFVYSSGDGADTYDVSASGINTNTLDLKNLNVSDVMLGRNGSDLLVTDNGTGQTITVKNEFSDPQAGVGSIAFGDGTVWNRDQIGSNDWFRAGSGDISLTADDGDRTLVAGGGNDTLIGGAGNDTFIYKATNGDLTIQDHADAAQPGRSNTLMLGNLNAADLSFSQQNNDLVIAITATGHTITVAGEFNSPDHDGVQKIKFADGTQWLQVDIRQHTHPGA